MSNSRKKENHQKYKDEGHVIFSQIKDLYVQKTPDEAL